MVGVDFVGCRTLIARPCVSSPQPVSASTWTTPLTARQPTVTTRTSTARPMPPRSTRRCRGCSNRPPRAARVQAVGGAVPVDRPPAGRKAAQRLHAGGLRPSSVDRGGGGDRVAAPGVSRHAESGAAADDRAIEEQVEREEPYNCEHTVPQGWLEHHEPMRGDLHHLFTCDKQCNNFRANSPFADFEDRLSIVRERCGASEGAGVAAEPRGPDRVLGGQRADAAGVARRGAGERLRAASQRRNLRAQGNRNPLIDHPGWASRIAFAEGI
jgi:hypothetical protein